MVIDVRTGSFSYALEMMLRGRVVQRASTPGVLFRFCNGFIEHNVSGGPYEAHRELYNADIVATDWEIVE